MARLKTEIRVAALLRQAQTAGAFAAVLRRGDADAGAFWVITRAGVVLHRYVERLAMTQSMDGSREWHRDGPFTQDELDAKINREIDIDPDVWIVEVEDAQGRAFLDGELAKPQSAAQSAATALFRGR